MVGKADNFEDVEPLAQFSRDIAADAANDRRDHCRDLRHRVHRVFAGGQLP